MHISPSYPGSGAEYRLRVTAGTDHDSTNHQEVEVNGAISSLVGLNVAVNLAVKVKDYHGLPLSAPLTSNYFDHNLHRDDNFSIAFSIVFDRDVNGNDLVFGNFFKTPIEHKLPDGFKLLTGLIKRWGDKSIEFNMKGKNPSVHAPALTSFSQLRIGVEGPTEAQKLGRHSVVMEGCETESGSEILEKQGVPTTAEGRKEFFQAAENREEFWFFGGIQYLADFGNHDLNFRNLCLNIPGKPLAYYQLLEDEEHQLRYTLKNVKTGEIYLVVVFSVVMSNEEANTLAGKQKAAVDLVALEGMVDIVRRQRRRFVRL
ncbi:uncharacterized protein N7484_003211 [Penicillium longicatenatum]|uniref:uncharacterized protein n=1 Tax=Penicillium longicatenatum TaxID=1561947 RepID=UPI002546A792|nr:uncharacterized protein N7484_003211 [Penicillium longicatenatum]KAJ5649488.1 hypothetical protein N7484_003211 [Penicillium longicatenatum]